MFLFYEESVNYLISFWLLYIYEDPCSYPLVKLEFLSNENTLRHSSKKGT